MLHGICSRNPPFSVQVFRSITNKCQTCSAIKPRFYQHKQGTLLKAPQPFEKLDLYFKRPIPTKIRNKYILTIIDEYSWYPFALLCSDVSAETVIRCIYSLVSLLGVPTYVYADSGTAVMSGQLKKS